MLLRPDDDPRSGHMTFLIRRVHVANTTTSGNKTVRAQPPPWSRPGPGGGGNPGPALHEAKIRVSPSLLATHIGKKFATQHKVLKNSYFSGGIARVGELVRQAPRVCVKKWRGKICGFVLKINHISRTFSACTACGGLHVFLDLDLAKGPKTRTANH